MTRDQHHEQPGITSRDPASSRSARQRPSLRRRALISLVTGFIGALGGIAAIHFHIGSSEVSTIGNARQAGTAAVPHYAAQSGHGDAQYSTAQGGRRNALQGQSGQRNAQQSQGGERNVQQGGQHNIAQTGQGSVVNLGSGTGGPGGAGGEGGTGGQGGTGGTGGKGGSGKVVVVTPSPTA